VRREWLASFPSRKTLPKDAGVVIATGLTAYRSITGTAIERGNLLAHQFFGIDRADYWGPDKLAQLVAESPTKAQHIILAVVLGGMESATSKETWRHPSAPMQGYFQRLADWGYALSEVEQLVICDNPTGEGAVEFMDDEDAKGEKISPKVTEIPMPIVTKANVDTAAIQRELYVSKGCTQ
jgi:ParB family chromosome partitioning protein